MADCRVRRAHVDDAAGIAEVHIAAWSAAYRGIMADEILDSLDLDRQTAGWAKSLSAEQNPMSTLAAVQPVAGASAGAEAPADRIVGFGGVCPPRDTAEVLDRLPEASGLGQLAAINLRPEAFGTGVGALLLHALEDELRALGYTHAYLMVAEGNARAMGFYAKHGWHRTEITHVFDAVSPAVPERMFTIDLGD
ncbi:MAG: GNAT family N-acetyltransferase [Brevibacterium sp.]|uniref:GNAT family N-acetyltransferase n=1 Tax=Brevibacterium sp. TaxID=1701 RepID=UPI0026472151|nr:GNAT family N-acetyltransferase [Brevibacterium sp.]MDN5805996.1 GNAT family N-acetyltransferase [Brevibacterium sp.]MDN5833041.1 GNAT family N-acetyltransferase [Brevibacterium sp.]MDN5877504.1 GNAT family N-acetyltransferase [Brevibacterium sp.]MDN5908124.1 GNAT family N-acetyltransferase [Brevibacterium sp.]MDN6123766.1 GNAT family N-acetyltransferase [Brevibacterium sp.]